MLIPANDMVDIHSYVWYVNLITTSNLGILENMPSVDGNELDLVSS